MRMHYGISPHPRRSLRLTTVALLACLGGFSSTARASVRSRRAWLDAKGACCFPLAPGPLPVSRAQLADSLTRGWERHLRFPEGGQIVRTQGGWYPALGQLDMRLAGGIMEPDRDRDEAGLHPSGKVESRIAVRRFELDGSPMICEKAKVNLQVVASDARLDLEHDLHGRPMLMLSDAREARLEFSATRADLERLLVLSGNEGLRRWGITVHRAALDLRTRDNRTIDVDLRIETKVGFIPAGMRFRAHVDIDDHMNARLSHLTCDGDSALGPLLIQFIRPGLKKYEGAVKPLFTFPGEHLKLHAVELQGGEEIRIAADFGR